MPLEGSGSVARPFCCRAGAWWPTPAFDGWVATHTYSFVDWGVFGSAASEGGAVWPEVMAPLFFCDAIGGVWKC